MTKQFKIGHFVIRYRDIGYGHEAFAFDTVRRIRSQVFHGLSLQDAVTPCRKWVGRHNGRHWSKNR